MLLYHVPCLSHQENGKPQGQCELLPDSLSSWQSLYFQNRNNSTTDDVRLPFACSPSVPLTLGSKHARSSSLSLVYTLVKIGL